MFLADGFLDNIFSTLSDSTIYFCMGAVGTILFLIRLIMMLIGGVGGDGDFDMQIDADGHFDGAEHGGFSLFSMFSILSFMMGAGWMGLACRHEWELGAFVSAACASLFGFSLLLLSSFGMYQMRKLNEVGSYDVQDCVGEVGRVYLTIPAKGQGRGEIQITFKGRQKKFSAVSSGEEIESFAAVKVLGIEEGETVIVEKAQS